MDDVEKRHQPILDAEVVARLRDNVARVVIGKSAIVDSMLVAVLCEGHVLLEDMPGMGKTLLAIYALCADDSCQFEPRAGLGRLAGLR